MAVAKYTLKKKLNSLHQRTGKLILPHPSLSTEQKMNALGILKTYRNSLLTILIKDYLRISSIRKFLTEDAAKTPVTSYILSRLD